MSDKPEPLAAILKEMRREGALSRRVLALADRIEAAAEREREKAKDLSKELDGNRAIAGNAAAMRAALERCNELFRCDNDNKSRLCHLARKADEAAQAALSAPPRNCDRFATADEAAREYCREAFFSGYEDPVIHAAFRWAFAPAEGGAE